MSADDLRTLIRTDVLADEPPFAMSGSRWREAGARVVRRRRRVHVATSLVAVGFLAGALMIVPRLHVGVDAGGGTDMLAKAQRALDEFDRDTFPQVFDAEVRHALGDSLPESVEGRVEPTLGGWTRLRPADYAYTDAWTATYDLSPTDRLVVMLQHDQSANEGDAQRECREDLKNGWMERCTAGALDDGSVAISEVYKVQHTAVGFRPGRRAGRRPGGTRARSSTDATTASAWSRGSTSRRPHWPRLTGSGRPPTHSSRPSWPRRTSSTNCPRAASGRVTRRTCCRRRMRASRASCARTP